MTIEIVDFPINSMVIFNSYVKLPEGNMVVQEINYKRGLLEKKKLFSSVFPAVNLHFESSSLGNLAILHIWLPKV